ncbi:transketolase family protein [Zhaonella formicivorans]|uniref:transketolase family protein n=1 Tax=Zhaonella formicivorans TaxID=2528593 RepID=UPI0010E4872D|nr:transketolase family protein [Zhaonella formicivorans]
MSKIATRDAYGKALVRLGEENKDIVVLDADLAKSTKTIDFAKAFPERFFDLGIAEQNLIGTAAGLSLSGKIPFASSFAMFATGRAFEQVRNSVAYPKLNVKIAATHAGITVGEDGASHQTVEDIAIMRALPNMTVIVPADGIETEQAVRAAAGYKGPVYIRLGRSAVPVIYDDDYKFEIGKASVLREGKDVTVFATGIMVSAALDAADSLAGEGVEVEVINVSTIKPLDAETVVRSLQKTKAGVTAEEHSIIGGLGAAVAELSCENCPVPLVRVGIKDVFGESGTPNELLVKYGLTSEDIVQAVRNVLQRK